MADRKEKKKKEKFVDDGRTVVDMNIEGTPWYRGKNADNNVPKLSRKERFAVFKGSFMSMIPIVLCTIVGVAVAGLLVWLWLR